MPAVAAKLERAPAPEQYVWFPLETGGGTRPRPLYWHPVDDWYYLATGSDAVYAQWVQKLVDRFREALHRADQGPPTSVCRDLFQLNERGPVPCYDLDDLKARLLAQLGPLDVKICKSASNGGGLVLYTLGLRQAVDHMVRLMYAAAEAGQCRIDISYDFHLPAEAAADEATQLHVPGRRPAFLFVHEPAIVQLKEDLITELCEALKQQGVDHITCGDGHQGQRGCFLTWAPDTPTIEWARMRHHLTFRLYLSVAW
eukprot:TRINITY_DN70563_c0_g1_i1.p1 TRINITY_DN70563_c0_g1~~TRINITY_DN70563_c0_g1_i1.p1  ORF type:complete len:256 (+),score=29.23 TRINITY_DN70563_c0_g1_i1:123-890(+)